MTFSNRLDPDQAQQYLGPNLDPICLTLRWWYSWKNFSKKLILKKTADDKFPINAIDINCITCSFERFALCYWTYCLLWSSANNLCKQNGPRSDQQYLGSDPDQICLTLIWYSWIFFSKKLVLKKISRRQKKCEKFRIFFVNLILDLICLTLRWYSWKNFSKKLILKKISRRQKKSMKIFLSI